MGMVSVGRHLWEALPPSVQHQVARCPLVPAGHTWKIGNITVLDPPAGEGDAAQPIVRVLGPHFSSMGAVAYALIGGCALAFAVYLGPYMSFTNWVIFSVLAFGTLWAFTKCATTNPGIVRSHDDDASDAHVEVSTALTHPDGQYEVDDVESAPVTGKLSVTARSGTAKALATSSMGIPGSKRRAIPHSTRPLEPGSHYCSECALIVPERAVHCEWCNVCVRGHDHHCPWIGQCVGEGNIMYFWTFLLALACTMAFMMFVGISVAVSQGSRGTGSGAPTLHPGGMPVGVH